MRTAQEMLIAGREDVTHGSLPVLVPVTPRVPVARRSAGLGLEQGPVHHFRAVGPVVSMFEPPPRWLQADWGVG